MNSILATSGLILSLIVCDAIASLPEEAPSRIVETYQEDFTHFDFDRPYRWDKLGDSSSLLCDKVQGWIGISNPSDQPAGWKSELLGRGDGITHHLNHSLYHKRIRTILDKSYELALRIKTPARPGSGRFLFQIQWFDEGQALHQEEFVLPEGHSEWVDLSFQGAVPREATEYQLMVTGVKTGAAAGPARGGADNSASLILLDKIVMKVYIEDFPVAFPSSEELRRLKVEFPLNVREFHVWWHTPWHTSDWAELTDSRDLTKSPFSRLWDRHAWFITRDYWQRDISARQYPLIGPYDSYNRHVIKWQVESMKNTGLEGAFINLFPNQANFDMDYGRAETIFARLLDAAEEAGFKVALYDENYRNDLIANAARDVLFLREYIHRPGYYRIKGQPAIWIQNFNEHLYNPDQLRDLIRYIEGKLDTDLYWVVSLFRFNRSVTDKRRSYLEIEEIDCVDFRYAVEEIAKNQETGEISWYAMREGLRDFVEVIRSSAVRHDWSASVSPGFDTVVDYTREADVITDGYVMPYQRREMGLTLLKELHLLAQQDPPPAFVTIKSWNDYHEGHGIEPGFYYEGDETEPLGMNQDPYFYNELVAKTLRKKFVPADLPRLGELDPLIQPLLSKSEAKRDVYGPLFVERRLDTDTFYCRLKDYQGGGCRLIWDQKPAAGFQVEEGQIEQWGLLLQQGESAQRAFGTEEVGGKWALRLLGAKAQLSITLEEEIWQKLDDKSRVFLIFSFFERKNDSRQYASIRLDYPVRGPVRMQDRRIRVLNNWTWKWGVQQLYEAWFREENTFRISVDDAELLLHALYVVIPGLSQHEERIEPAGADEYVLKMGAEKPERILYTQDAEGHYGNLMLVDFENARVIPEVNSIVTR